MHTGILIDPHARTVTEVSIPDTELPTLYRTIGCELIDCVDITIHNDEWFKRYKQNETLVVDDEGLLKQNKFFTLKVPGFEGRFFAGKALILGCNGDGDMVGAKMHFSVARKLVEWMA